MTLPFYRSLDIATTYYRGYLDNGFFFDSKFIDNDSLNDLRRIDIDAGGHESDKLFWCFHYWFNPSDKEAPHSKEYAIKILKSNINYFKNLENMSFDDYLILKMNEYFLQVYKSENTKIRPNNYDVVELFETTGYRPYFFLYT